jgi:hypothetical protein
MPVRVLFGLRPKRREPRAAKEETLETPRAPAPGAT